MQPSLTDSSVWTRRVFWGTVAAAVEPCPICARGSAAWPWRGISCRSERGPNGKDWNWPLIVIWRASCKRPTSCRAQNRRPSSSLKRPSRVSSKIRYSCAHLSSDTTATEDNNNSSSSKFPPSSFLTLSEWQRRRQTSCSWPMDVSCVSTRIRPCRCLFCCPTTVTRAT